MQTKTNYTPKIETRLIIPHEDKITAFVYPSFGPNNYQSVGKEILNHGYKLPTGSETASLLNATYLSELKDKPEFQNIREIMRNRWLWVYLNDYWTDKGLYVIDDDKGEGLSRKLALKDLERKLKGGKEIKGTNVRISNDGKIRFASKESDNYQLGEQTAEELSINDIVIAQYIKEGAEKLGEVAAQFEHTPHLSGFNINEGQAPELRVSAVGGYGDRLLLGGGFGNSGSGRAFGVF